jgi:hypothetical protein
MWTAAAIGVALICCAIFAFIASARNATSGGCINHLHTIQTALMLYASDSDGNLPPFAFGPAEGATPQPREFIASLASQGLAPKAWICPADSHSGTGYKGLWTDFKFSSYAMPPSLLAKGKVEDSGSFVLALPTDSTTIVLLDQPFRDGKAIVSAHGRWSTALYGF